MRSAHALVFADLVGTDDLWTGVEWAEKLAQYDEMAMFCVVETLGMTAGDVYVTIFHSGDGEAYDQKNGNALVDSEVHVNWTASDVAYAWGSDPTPFVDPPTPFLEFVRLRVRLLGTGTCRVKVYVTQRDQGREVSS